MPVRIAFINKSTTKCERGCGEKGTSCIGAATMENSMEIPQKIKNGSAYDPAIPLLNMN